MGFDTVRFIQAFQRAKEEQRGRQEREEQKKFQQEQRKLQLEELDIKRKQLKFEQNKEKLAMLQGQPAPERQVGSPVSSVSPQPPDNTGSQVNADSIIAGNQSRQVAPMPSAIPGGFKQEMPVPGVTFGKDAGVEEPFTVKPTTMQQLLRQRNEEQRIKARSTPGVVIPRGGILADSVTGATRATGTPPAEPGVGTQAAEPAIIRELRAFYPNFDQLDDAGKMQALQAYVKSKQAPSQAQPARIDPLSQQGRDARLEFDKQKAAQAAPSPYTEERARRVTSTIDRIMPNVNGWTTGYGNFFFSRLPETEARILEGDLSSLKSSIAQNELVEMRAASKTGGALGNISDKDISLLEDAIANLDPLQGAKALKERLAIVRDVITRYGQRRTPAPTDPGSGWEIVP